MQMHANDTIKTSDIVLREIYLSFYLKGLCVRGSWRANRTATYWPPTLVAISVSFPFSWAAQPGTWGPATLGHVSQSSILFLTRLITNCSIGGREPTLLGAGFLYLILSPTGLVSKTNWLPVFTELYNSSTPPFFCGRHNCIHSTHPWSRL